MTLHTPIKAEDRTLLPRGLLPRRPSFRFKINQTVRAADMLAIVKGRSRTARGLEMYDVQITGDDHGRPFRTFMAHALEPMNEDPTYTFAFETGERVILTETGDLAVISGRVQVLGSIDEYIVELVDADCAPLRVRDFEISAG